MSAAKGISTQCAEQRQRVYCSHVSKVVGVARGVKVRAAACVIRGGLTCWSRLVRAWPKPWCVRSGVCEDSGMVAKKKVIRGVRLHFAHRNLPLLLLQAREHVISHFRPTLNAHGVTEQQWRIVRLLVDAGPLEPRVIGEQCRISSPSMAGVLSRMEDLALIKRERFANDQRRVLVSLTARSRALAARMAPEIDATYDRIEALVGKDFSVRLYRALDQLIETLNAVEAEESDGD
jgi:homoprotocatechuate degradation regulator HpaR